MGIYKTALVGLITKYVLSTPSVYRASVQSAWQSVLAHDGIVVCWTLDTRRRRVGVEVFNPIKSGLGGI